MKKCPFCAGEIQDEAIKCKQCGADITTPSNPQQQGYYAVSKKNKTIGIILIIAPFAGLFFILIAYAIAQFVLSAILTASQ